MFSFDMPVQGMSKQVLGNSTCFDMKFQKIEFS